MKKSIKTIMLVGSGSGTCHLTLCICILMVNVCNAQTKAIKANSFSNAIMKIQEKDIGKSFDNRLNLILNSIDLWEEPLTDTLFIVVIRNLNASTDEEYIVASNKTYKLQSKYNSAKSLQLFNFPKSFEPLTAIVTDWDKSAFEEKKNIVTNDGDAIDAIRIIHDGNKYLCSYTSFYDNNELVRLAGNPDSNIDLDKMVATNIETIINGRERINQYYFANIKELNSINVPFGVKEIDAYAFAGCNDLKEVYLPKSVKCIDVEAFYNCPNMTSLYISGNKPPKLKRTTEPFGSLGNITVIVPKTAIKKYLKHPQWGQYKIESL